MSSLGSSVQSMAKKDVLNKQLDIQRYERIEYMMSGG